MAFGNFWISLILRSPLHRMLSGMFLIITLRGRKSGRTISTPVNYLTEGGELIVTSLRSRTWWRNLRGGAAVSLRLRGKECSARAAAVETPADVADGFRRMFVQYPSFAKAFGVGREADGKFREEDLARLAKERVMIRLRPEQP